MLDEVNTDHDISETRACNGQKPAKNASKDRVVTMPFSLTGKRLSHHQHFHNHSTGCMSCTRTQRLTRQGDETTDSGEAKGSDVHPRNVVYFWPGPRVPDDSGSRTS